MLDLIKYDTGYDILAIVIILMKKKENEIEFLILFS